jgi:hypothetical protein
MAKANKTAVTQTSVQDFLAALSPEARRADAASLCEAMARVSGEPPRMWGPGIIGFGERRYRYDSGREGAICRIGFSPRKDALALYGMGVQDNPLLETLGKHQTGKGCLYIKRLSDVDAKALEAVLGRGWNGGAD